nr:hypothetical protein [Tanacetum cinerariifolium]
MSTSRIFIYLDTDNESTDLFVSYIILSDSKDEDIASPVALAPPLVDYVQASPNYISAAIAKENAAPPCKRRRSPSPPPSPSSSPSSPRIRIRRDNEGSPSTFKIRESTTHIFSVTGETIHRTIPLLVARLNRHEDQIHEMQDHLKELSLEKFKAMKQDKKGLYGSIEATQQDVKTLRDTLQVSRERITYLEIRLEDTEVANGGENKRKWDENKNNSGKQNKRQEVARAFTARTSKKKGWDWGARAHGGVSEVGECLCTAQVQGIAWGRKVQDNSWDDGRIVKWLLAGKSVKKIPVDPAFDVDFKSCV